MRDATLAEDKRELLEIERMFSALIAHGGALSDRGAELNARLTAALVAMHGMLDADQGKPDEPRRAHPALALRARSCP